MEMLKIFTYVFLSMVGVVWLFAAGYFIYTVVRWDKERRYLP